MTTDTSRDSLRRAYGLGPRIPAPQPAVSPLYTATERARRDFKAMTIAFSNEEATEADLLAVARKLRGLQAQWSGR